MNPIPGEALRDRVGFREPTWRAQYESFEPGCQRSFLSSSLLKNRIYGRVAGSTRKKGTYQFFVTYDLFPRNQKQPPLQRQRAEIGFILGTCLRGFCKQDKRDFSRKKSKVYHRVPRSPQAVGVSREGAFTHFKGIVGGSSIWVTPRQSLGQRFTCR